MRAINGDAINAIEVRRDPLTWADLDSFRGGHEALCKGKLAPRIEDCTM